MGAILWSLENCVNTILDIVVIKTGFVISEDYLVELLKEAFPDDKTFHEYEKRRNYAVRLRSEEFEAYCWEIRRKLGELEENNYPNFIGNPTRMLELMDEGYDPIKTLSRLVEIMSELHDPNNPKYIDPNEVVKIAIREQIAPDYLVIELMNDIINKQKYSNDIFPVEEMTWDGGTDLNDLFSKESLPKHDSDFVEQKFINYLQANPDKLESMHWRNFERLVAEFFKRENYVVKLGPGTNDGGVDVRVYNKDDDTKPYIIIQCKRHKKSHEVKIETVKSFYTDVEFEGASKGLIVTTSRIATGGKKVVKIRKYPLQFAENEEIKQWVNKMRVR